MIIDNKTVSLLHFDNKDNILKDVFNNTWINNKGAYDNTGKFVGSVDLTNSGYFYTTDSAIVNLTEYTIDFWAYVPSNTIDYYRICFGTSTKDKYYGIISSDTFSTPSGNIYLTNIDEGLKVNDWNNFAFIFKDKWYLFVNGKLTANIETSVLPKMSDMLCIGNYKNTDNNAPSLAKIDELRISNIARWTSDFDVPSSAYTDKYVMYLDKDGNVYSR